MDTVKSAASIALTTAMNLLIIATASGTAYAIALCSRPIVGVVVGIALVSVAFVGILELSFRVGRNLGRYGHVFDLRESGGTES